MDARSKLPKPSRLKYPNTSSYYKSTPATEVKPTIPKTTEIIPKKLVRRSKSMSDLRLNTFNRGNPLQSSVLKNGNSNKNEPPRAGVKRAAAVKIDPGTKPKVVRQGKIPDWDYKSRFQNLLEKHTKLQEDYKKTKEQIAGIEALEDQHNVLLGEHDNLRMKHEDLVKIEKDQSEKLQKLQDVEKDLLDLRIRFKKLSEDNTKNVSLNQDLISLNNNLKQSLEEQTALIETLKTHLAKLKEDYIKNESLRRQLHNTIQDLKGNIRVFCRVRPPINQIENEKLQYSINYPDETSIEIRKSKESISSISGKPTDCKQEFTFDFVFTEDSSQAEFFEELAQLVQSAIDGYDVCVFAYGQTGSGKTYTMQGLDAPEHVGMIPRTINLIFDTIESLSRSNWNYVVKVSFLEIYNETVRDLLDPNANHSLDICFNDGKGTTVTNLSIETISCCKDFDSFMKVAQMNRMVAATNFNEHSSRSHAITKIYITGSNTESCACYSGSVNLVDLAGSESAKTSHGERLVETKSINKSLSTLGNVMLALHNKDKHIPYRNSKLTYLLQSCLGGNSKTMMIVNISPFEDNYGESINSLRFASKVKEVKNKIKRNKAIMQQSLII